jgi:hypothetical protein
MRAARVGLLIAVSLWSLSCSSEKTLRADDLRSQVAQGIAFASEEELFINRLLEQRITQNFASGHLEYLLHEVHRAVQQANQEAPEKAIASQFAQYQTQMERVEHSLVGLRGKLTDKSVLLDARREVQESQLTLQHARETL